MRRTDTPRVWTDQSRDLVEAPLEWHAWDGHQVSIHQRVEQESIQYRREAYARKETRHGR